MTDISCYILGWLLLIVSKNANADVTVSNTFVNKRENMFFYSLAADTNDDK